MRFRTKLAEVKIRKGTSAHTGAEWTAWDYRLIMLNEQGQETNQSIVATTFDANLSAAKNLQPESVGVKGFADIRFYVSERGFNTVKLVSFMEQDFEAGQPGGANDPFNQQQQQQNAAPQAQPEGKLPF